MNEFVDVAGQQVHAFSIEVNNVGYGRLADLLLSMFESGSWQKFQDGLGTYEFWPGEFDYFLTQQGVRREDVMNGVRDLDVKARLEAAMDERRTGEEGYRRRLTEVREQNPNRPGRPIMPFGYRRSDAKDLVAGGVGQADAGRRHREALGDTVRRYAATGESVKPHRRESSELERVERSMRRLDEGDLAKLIELTKIELDYRKRTREAKEMKGEES